MFIFNVLLIFLDAASGHNFFICSKKRYSVLKINCVKFFVLSWPQIIFDNILNRKIPWPSVPDDMSYEAQDLINRLAISFEFVRCR